MPARAEHNPILRTAANRTRYLLVVAALVLTGCQNARVDRPLTAELGASDEDTQLEFWHTLAEQPVTSNDDAFHGLLLFLDGTDPATDYAGRVAALQERRYLA